VRIAIYDCEEKKHNTALMQISQYYKNKGVFVEWYFPLAHDQYDKIYCSSLFDFSDKSLVTNDMICGGTGFDIKKKLPKEIEECDLDYSIYEGNCDTSYIWFSRGCVRDYKFCIVREKEGYIHPVKPKNLNPNGKHITICDNNFFMNPKWEEAIEQIKEWDQKVNFMGIDIRSLTNEQAEILNNLRHGKQIKFAWDNPKEDLEEKFRNITRIIKPYKIMVYVLIGYNSTEGDDFYRVEVLRRLGIDPFVMPYIKNNTYQKRFSRWVNNKAVFKSVAWEDYS